MISTALTVQQVSIFIFSEYCTVSFAALVVPGQLHDGRTNGIHLQFIGHQSGKAHLCTLSLFSNLRASIVVEGGEKCQVELY